MKFFSSRPRIPRPEIFPHSLFNVFFLMAQTYFTSKIIDLVSHPYKNKIAKIRTKIQSLLFFKYDVEKHSVQNWSEIIFKKESMFREEL